MKNTRTWVILSVAILSGLLAVLLAGRWLDRQSHSDITQVVVARTEISLGQRLAPEMLKLVDWPKNSLPPGAHVSTEKLDGRVLKAGLQRGEPVLEAKLAPQGTQGGLSAVIAEGKRAITVRVNDVIGVAGFALPGNYVDIIVNTQKDGERVNHDQNISKIVLEKILVLAVAQEVSRDETRPRVVNAVTLEVTPEEAEKIDLARSVGSLSLVLRNQVDPNPIRTAGITKNDLLSIQNGGLKSDSVVVGNPKVNATAVRKKSNQTNPIQIARSSSVPTASTTVPEPTAECVGVLTGLRSSSECY
jgi:pilus assembly protein CpaB